ncbi:conserved hypothetical protein [Verticillium alfalfae VaMs.102]|uniref:Uncharacterized protein n=1 Tax=Verticillium alfalfae (strain VaMs.102 / ATCC MYA-4576 / FGSC 10136) TaxID=526221 RepID=C9SD37_VERA1|nr:conserved hypothetical protein [Verticillium alfalfae VaMs.102]EEY17002.1 conserved hypothetical protein [Verticillium alfalfae VaMs.102]
MRTSLNTANTVPRRGSSAAPDSLSHDDILFPKVFEDAWGSDSSTDRRSDLERARIFLLRFVKMSPDTRINAEVQAIVMDHNNATIPAVASAIQMRLFGNSHASFATTPLMQCVRFMLIKARVPSMVFSEKTKTIMDFFFDPSLARNLEPAPATPVNERGRSYALGLAFDRPAGLAWSQPLNVFLTLGQTRYLLNASDFDGRGYLNMQLTEEEWDKMVSVDGKFVTFGNPGCLRRPDGSVPQGFNESQAVREGVQLLPPADSMLINRPHALVAVAGDAAMTVHFWPGRGLNSGIKSGIALGDEIVHALNSGRFIGLPLDAMKEYNDFIMKLQGREHDKRSIPILNQSGSPEMLGWLLSKAHTVPDEVAIEWLIGAMTQIADRLEQRPDWAFPPVANVEPQLRIVLRQLNSVTLREMAVSFPWPTREMGGAEVLPIRSMKPEEKQKWLQQLWGLLSAEKGRETGHKRVSSRDNSALKSPSASRFEAPRNPASKVPRAPSPSPQFLAPEPQGTAPQRTESQLRRSNAVGRSRSNSRAVSPGPAETNHMVPGAAVEYPLPLRPRSPSAGGDVNLGRLLSVSKRPGKGVLSDAMSLALFRVDGSD